MKDWEIKGIPKAIYMRAKGEADEKNYESVNANDEETAVSIWECVTLKECKDIVTAGNHWSDLFEEKFTLPGEERKPGGKAAKTEWIEKIDKLQNKLKNPSYSITTEEFRFIEEVLHWSRENKIELLTV